MLENILTIHADLKDTVAPQGRERREVREGVFSRNRARREEL